jgi:hypothetical protein
MFRGWGKNVAIILQKDKTGAWDFSKQVFFDKWKTVFRVRKGEAHYVDTDLLAYRKGSSKVYFFNKEKARPMIPNLDAQDIEASKTESSTIKTTFKEISHNPTPKKGEQFSLNQRSDAIDDFIVEKAFQQHEHANRQKKSDSFGMILYLIMGAVMGILGGYILGSNQHAIAGVAQGIPSIAGKLWSILH